MSSGIANFFIEPHIDVFLHNAQANALLFILAPKMFELLKDLLPELILMEAGEQAHLDIGRIQNMLGRIDEVGPYTRASFTEGDDKKNVIFLDWRYPTRVAVFCRRSKTNKCTLEAQGNRRLFIAAQTMAIFFEEIMSGHLHSHRVSDLIDYVMFG